ncbi:MAG: 4'-phosphopantetheinyl transferase superfamily protein [Anaerolineae bacterium]|nr:4'-phosphopantetheinyl transferase superfamily protein [Anaerolineae bacterium]
MSTVWPLPPAVWALPDDEVHVWLVTLDRPEARVAALAAQLSADELERAERFYRERARNRFIVARGLLRTIVGSYLDAPPPSLRFALNAHGKPVLASHAAAALSFNISHSSGLALFAMTKERAVGVDIERLRSDLDYKRLARRFFSPAEFAQFAALPEEVKRDAFFHCWTRKEAYIKGQGVGIALGLDSFDVSLEPDTPARLLATRPDAAEADQWQLRSLEPAPGYAAAVAVRGRNWQLRCWRWPDEEADP